jgi:hypothetical protein
MSGKYLSVKTRLKHGFIDAPGTLPQICLRRPDVGVAE